MKNNIPNITKRELDIIREICKGGNNKEIAESLNIKEKTVKTHLENIYAKLPIHSRIGLAVYALKNNIIEII